MWANSSNVITIQKIYKLRNLIFNRCRVILLMLSRVPHSRHQLLMNHRKMGGQFWSGHKWMSCSLFLCTLPKSTQMKCHSLNCLRYQRARRMKWKAREKQSKNGSTSLWITVKVFTLSNKYREYAWFVVVRCALHCTHTFTPDPRYLQCTRYTSAKLWEYMQCTV